MTDFAELKLRDLRLTMLKSLKAQRDRTLNQKILQAEARGLAGLAFPIDVIRNELRFLERAGAVSLAEPGTVLIATLKQRGQDHLDRLIELEGVEQPSLEG